MTIKATDPWTRAEKDAGRSILLEVPPWPIDGGELIGRDPRKVLVEEFTRAGLEAAPLLKVIRAKCLDCCVQQEAEVRKCVAITCPNWPYRMGANPFFTRELTEEQRAKLSAAARARFGLPPVQDAPPAQLAKNLAWLKSDGGSAGTEVAQEAPDA